jgi:3-hydroxyisobutyrate dehydrogenase-like beta-hydroxyacid dehydrogenase
MNTKNKSYEPKFSIKNTAKDKAAIKTVSLQVAVTRPDLQNTIRKAFDLAKGGGRELDLAFSL